MPKHSYQHCPPLRCRCGIPFNIANHDRLGDDPAVAALCAYLALAADPGCDPAFEAVLSLPHHGLGELLVCCTGCCIGVGTVAQRDS